MIELLKGKRFSEHLFLFAAIAFAVGLSTSKVILSLSTMLLLLAVLWNKDIHTFRDKWKEQRVLIPLIAYLGLHVLALLWTSDFSYASNDLKTKLTILIVPLAFMLHPLEKNARRLILNFFVASVFVTSLINILTWHQFFGFKTYTDIRELSLFGSHIRYGILIAMAAAISVLHLKDSNNYVRGILLMLFCWFSYYTYFSQIISGLLALITVVFAFVFWYSYQRSRLLAFGFLLLPVSIVIFLLTSLFTETKEISTSSFKDLPLQTVSGNPYTHNLEPGTFIDGRPVLAYLCEEELRESWNRRSEISYDGKDEKGQPVRFTLMRFLTDLNARKDSVGCLKLTEADIDLIENGIASREEGEGGLWARWNGVRFQLQNHLDPNGHSLLQRIEYWKTAWKIIQNHWLIGVGTGDVQQAFDQQYQKDNSQLLPEYRLRAHNTYLTSWVSFGLLGLLLLVWMILSFITTSLKRSFALGFVFMMVAATTFLLEDTLETQMGASFFAFFFGIALSPFTDSEESTIS
jgi:hypothetical protein